MACEGGRETVKDFWVILAVMAAYFVLQRWILPRMGVQT
jgi:hypothetical protein